MIFRLVFTISSAWIAMSAAGPSMPYIEGWWIMIREFGVAYRWPLGAHKARIDPIDAAIPHTSVRTGDVIILTWSHTAYPASTEPPGELMMKVIGSPGAVSSR